MLETLYSITEDLRTNIGRGNYWKQREEGNREARDETMLLVVDSRLTPDVSLNTEFREQVP